MHFESEGEATQHLESKECCSEPVSKSRVTLIAILLLEAGQENCFRNTLSNFCALEHSKAD
jgi:hypothetical protein